MAQVLESTPLADVADWAAYDAVFLVGGRSHCVAIAAGLRLHGFVQETQYITGQDRVERSWGTTAARSSLDVYQPAAAPPCPAARRPRRVLRLPQRRAADQGARSGARLLDRTIRIGAALGLRVRLGPVAAACPPQASHHRPARKQALTIGRHARPQVVGGMARAGKVVAAVCHGPMGLVNVKDEAGEPIVKGREVRRGGAPARKEGVHMAGVLPSCHRPAVLRAIA